MKQNKKILLYIFFWIAIGCSTNKLSTLSTQVIALPNNEEGTILIRSSGHGSNESEAVKVAEKKAFTALLFYGLPSSIQTTPLIEIESHTKKKNISFFDSFFENNDYKYFMVSSATYNNSQRAGKYIHLNRDIKINIRSLRYHLEKNGIIRKFGY
ncbi:MAG: hypothetical protein SFU87_18210 [Chitinophagaceae bacterium]|nr:hypothetical protein [Chitinophagaceae bacterium]